MAAAPAGIGLVCMKKRHTAAELAEYVLDWPANTVAAAVWPERAASSAALTEGSWMGPSPATLAQMGMKTRRTERRAVAASVVAAGADDGHIVGEADQADMDTTAAGNDAVAGTWDDPYDHLDSPCMLEVSAESVDRSRRASHAVDVAAVWEVGHGSWPADDGSSCRLGSERTCIDLPVNDKRR